MKVNMKWPLIIAAALVVLRVIVEQTTNLPLGVQKIFGVAWLYFLVPIYFAIQIDHAGDSSPIKSLLKNTALYVLYTRLMVMPTYMLAYKFQWPASRFSLDEGGVVGDGVTALSGYLWIPLRNLAVWVVAATIIGLIVGGVTFMIRRSSVAKRAA